MIPEVDSSFGEVISSLSEHMASPECDYSDNEMHMVTTAFAKITDVTSRGRFLLVNKEIIENVGEDPLCSMNDIFRPLTMASVAIANCSDSIKDLSTSDLALLSIYCSRYSFSTLGDTIQIFANNELLNEVKSKKEGYKERCEILESIENNFYDWEMDGDLEQLEGFYRQMTKYVKKTSYDEFREMAKDDPDSMIHYKNVHDYLKGGNKGETK